MINQNACNTCNRSVHLTGPRKHGNFKELQLIHSVPAIPKIDDTGWHLCIIFLPILSFP
ncbi:hypothetical protein PAXRUDRAFT_828805, partial [Paxillus rubicundulus Ve08.2h10]